MDSCKQHDFCYDCLMQWVMNKNTCPMCNETVKAIQMPDEAEMAFFSQSLPKLESRELESEVSPMTPVVGEAVASDMRSKIWLFDRTDSSIYFERGNIIATSDAEVTAITVKNAFFEQFFIKQTTSGGKLETSLKIKQQNNTPEDVIKVKD